VHGEDDVTSGIPATATATATTTAITGRDRRAALASLAALALVGHACADGKGALSASASQARASAPIAAPGGVTPNQWLDAGAFTAVALTDAGASLTRFEPGPEPRQTLRYATAAPGTSFRQSLDVAITERITVVSPSKSTTSDVMTGRFTLAVLTTSPAQDGAPWTYHLGDVEVVGSSERAPLLGRLLDDWRAVDGELAVDPLLGPFPDHRPVFDMRGPMSDRLTSVLELALPALLPELPAEAVGQGGSWVATVGPGVSGFVTRGRIEVRVREVTAARTRLAVSLRSKGGPERLATTKSGEILREIAGSELGIDGELEHEPGRLWPRRAELDLRFAVTTTIAPERGGGNSVIAVEVKVVLRPD
jgi:hypothetical protein